MNNLKKGRAAILLIMFGSVVMAAVPPDEAARLREDLTPLGAERADNADGSIPPWTGGISAIPGAYVPGAHHPDPFPMDEPMFVITADNYQDHAEYLSDGQIMLFETYPETFRMPIYPTRRTASYPPWIYEAAGWNAVNAELGEAEAGVRHAAGSVPFPIPESGVEVVWNHLLRYRGQSVRRTFGQAAPQASGEFQVILFEEVRLSHYATRAATPEKLDEENIALKYKERVTAPPLLAGTALLLHEPLDGVRSPRQAWTYNTGQRRVRRAPNVAHDAPGIASDGLVTSDDRDMFNGSPNRYHWVLLGKKELYIAYNSYKLHDPALSYEEILQPGHINPDLTRYEKHRVWVVEGRLKEGLAHLYGKRVFYVDEDSWQIQVADLYDNRGALFRVSIAYGLNYYEVPTHWSTLDVTHDLNARRYLAAGLGNQEPAPVFDSPMADEEFRPSVLRREGRR